MSRHKLLLTSLTVGYTCRHRLDTPEAPLTNFNDGGWEGGSDSGSYSITKKITTSEYVYPKKSLLFLVYPKNSLSPFFATLKNPSGFFFCDPKNNPGVFHRPKKSLFAKISDPKKSLGHPPPPPSLKYVSGAPGLETKVCFK